MTRGSGFKDLLVAVDNLPEARGRVNLAAELASQFDAHLTALYVLPMSLDPLPASFLDIGYMDRFYREAQEKAAAEAAASRAMFEDAARRYAISAEWREARGYPGNIVAQHGRYADLIILGQMDPEDGPAMVLKPRPEEVVLLAGRPLLVVPYAGAFTDIGRRVLVAWDAGREATRAVNDSLPLLASASSVTVLTVDAEPGRGGHGEAPGADIALYLARHSVKVQVERTVSAGIGVGQTLLSRASDLAADLLVMGAYGHGRVGELWLGGSTRTILASMTIPVLMAH